MSRPIALATNAFTAIAAGTPIEMVGHYNFNLSFGAAVGTVKLARSYDGGASWKIASKPDLTPASFTTDQDGVGYEPEAGVLYRWDCTAWTSGTINARLSR